jgi:hypothetical protein
MKNFILFFLINNLTFQVKSQVSKYFEIEQLLNNWHLAAAIADEETFFGSMDENAIYIGTDATEKWRKHELEVWSKKYFNRESAWNFKPLKREIYLSKNKKVAWFDEQLETWMGICQASGILEKKNKEWKIVHYQLSVTVPNEKMKSFVDMIQNKEAGK